MNVISAVAPAKINLYLHVTGKRQDGYHLLDSLAAFASLSDTVEVSAAKTITVSVAGDHAEQLSGDDNIVKKAAEVLQKHFNIGSGASITLHKNLPVGAGIGGGSADAATTLKLLLRLWKITVSEKELSSIALSLGADVPACLQSSTLYMSGVGEIIETGPKLPKLHLVLASTGKPLLTKNVFAKYDGKFSADSEHPKHFASKEDLVAFLGSTRNDLQNAAIALQPEIGTIISELMAEKECMLARMSGSGSTCFGIFTKRSYAENFALELGNRYPQWWVRAANLL